MGSVYFFQLIIKERREQPHGFQDSRFISLIYNLIKRLLTGNQDNLTMKLAAVVLVALVGIMGSHGLTIAGIEFTVST